ncbi:MAG: N-acetylglucosamine-6-phosphate deacetylase [Bacteroidetes bacterium]|nr:N-acetylglucosamine-6-phosphate deacetylase [Bacteroidota bacterium]MBS1973346.1 N-acetylglucosamine-6-phosphate deacetylase [Bacteroidota bacterium]
MQTAFIANKIFNGSEILTDSAVLVKDEEVVDVVSSSVIPQRYNVKNLGNCLLAPAFIDLQIYGGNGMLFSAELTTEALEATYEYCLEGGCSQFMITMATNSIEKFLTGIEKVREYWSKGGKGLLGLHLEGPYLNPAKKGAHIEKFIKKPTIEEVSMLLQKGKNVIRMMTVAPEQCSEQVIEMLLNNHIIVSAGHSNATYTEAIKGFQLGIPAATHLFNAMSPLQGREPGMVGAIYDSGAMSSVVCDGVHVSFPSIRISKRLMQEKLFFITDAVAEVRHGEYQHIFNKNKFVLPDGTLSGSALTMLLAVKNGIENAGIGLEEALRMGSLYPARLMNLDKKYGLIAPGSKAEFAVINEKLSLERIILDGE